MLLKLVVLAVSVALASGQSLEGISPGHTFRVPLKNGQKVREFVATDDGFRFLVQSSDGDFQLLSTGRDGQPKAERSIGTKMATGLVLTSNGLATVAVRNRKQFLVQLDLTGSVIHEEPLDCFGGSALLVISGNPATVCTDGTIVEHKPNGGTSRRASWIRPGSTAEILSNRKAVIIDTSTAEAVINDLESNALSPVSRIPEIEEIVKETHEKYRTAGTQGAEGSAPTGKPVVIMNTAQESSNWYVLVWPYHPKTGVLVASFDVAGNPVGKFLCRLPGEGLGVHRIDIRKNKLSLVSSGGEVFQYEIN